MNRATKKSFRRLAINEKQFFNPTCHIFNVFSLFLYLQKILEDHTVNSYSSIRQVWYLSVFSDQPPFSSSWGLGATAKARKATSAWWPQCLSVLPPLWGTWDLWEYGDTGSWFVSASLGPSLTLILRESKASSYLPAAVMLLQDELRANAELTHPEEGLSNLTMTTEPSPQTDPRLGIKQIADWRHQRFCFYLPY